MDLNFLNSEHRDLLCINIYVDVLFLKNMLIQFLYTFNEIHKAFLCKYLLIFMVCSFSVTFLYIFFTLNSFLVHIYFLFCKFIFETSLHEYCIYMFPPPTFLSLLSNSWVCCVYTMCPLFHWNTHVRFYSLMNSNSIHFPCQCKYLCHLFHTALYFIGELF